MSGWIGGSIIGYSALTHNAFGFVLGMLIMFALFRIEQTMETISEALIEDSKRDYFRHDAAAYVVLTEMVKGKMLYKGMPYALFAENLLAMKDGEKVMLPGKIFVQSKRGATIKHYGYGAGFPPPSISIYIHEDKVTGWRVANFFTI